MRSDRIEFEGSQGETLAARLDRPEGEPCAFALFAHCFTCSKDLGAVTRISEKITERGMAVLRFDFTGLGHSDGEFANTNFSSNVEDLVHASEWLREHEKAPRLLIGHSLGGAAVLAAAGEVEECRAVVTIGAPSEPEHVLKLLDGSRGEIEEKGEAEVSIAGRSFRVRRQFLEDVSSQKLSPRIASLGRALMIFHSPVDEIVGIDNAAEIYKAAKHPKSFVSLDDADHLLRKQADAHYVGNVLSSLVGRYLTDED